jgi:hypothetical protein
MREAISLRKEATPTDIETAMNRIPKALRVSTAEFCNSGDVAVSNLNHHECPQLMIQIPLMLLTTTK